VDPVRLIKVVHEHPDVTLVPPGSIKLDLEAAQGGPKGPPQRLSKHGDGHFSGGRGHTPGEPRGGPSRLRQSAGGATAAGPPDRETSWWTARATAGAVTAGFTKEEILRQPEADPRAEGGMFARVEELLRALG